MFRAIKASLQRKIARRITKEYPPVISTYHLKNDGDFEFANWSNPLISHRVINQEMVDFFKQFVSIGDLAIDIGANIGDTTVPIALAAGASGLTLGFDPNPLVFKILASNATLNEDKQRIIAYPYAISVEEEEFYFISSDASYTNGGISQTEKSVHGKYVYPEKIKGVNLVKFLEAHHASWIPKLSFLKVDAEGYDKEILKSIPELIARCKPVIVAESFAGNTDEEKMELWDVLHGHGYEISAFYEFDVNEKPIPLHCREDMTRFKKTHNVYARPV